MSAKEISVSLCLSVSLCVWRTWLEAECVVFESQREQQQQILDCLVPAIARVL